MPILSPKSSNPSFASFPTSSIALPAFSNGSSTASWAPWPTTSISLQSVAWPIPSVAFPTGFATNAAMPPAGASITVVTPITPWIVFLVPSLASSSFGQLIQNFFLWILFVPIAQPFLFLVDSLIVVDDNSIFFPWH